jgi:hypothetical protein
LPKNAGKKQLQWLGPLQCKQKGLVVIKSNGDFELFQKIKS